MLFGTCLFGHCFLLEENYFSEMGNHFCTCFLEPFAARSQKKKRFAGVLAVSVVLSVSVENPMDCQIRVDVVCTTRSAMSVPLKKTPRWSLLMLIPWGCHLLDGEKFLCGADDSRGESICKHLGLQKKMLWCMNLVS